MQPVDRASSAAFLWVFDPGFRFDIQSDPQPNHDGTRPSDLAARSLAARGAIAGTRTQPAALLLLCASVLLLGTPASATTINSGIDTYVDSYNSSPATSGPEIPPLVDVCFGASGLACGSVSASDGRAPAAGANNSGSGSLAGDDQYGLKWDTSIGYTSSVNEGLLWFDIPTPVLDAFNSTPGATATLQYNVFDNGSSGDMYRMTNNWLSGASSGNEVTWNSLGGGVMPGSNAEATSNGTMTASTGLNSLDVTADVAAWASGTDNYGWGIEAAGGSRARLSTFEDGDESLRPTLLLGVANRVAGTDFEDALPLGTQIFAGSVDEIGFSHVPAGSGTFGTTDAGSSGGAANGAVAYRMSSAGGSNTQLMTFDEVDLSGETGVTFSVDVWQRSSGYEPSDFIRITLEVEDESGPLPDITVIDHANDFTGSLTEGSWNTLTQAVPDSVTKATIKVETATNSGSQSERYYMDSFWFDSVADLNFVVPEPSTSLLLGLGFVGLVRIRRGQ